MILDSDDYVAFDVSQHKDSQHPCTLSRDSRDTYRNKEKGSNSTNHMAN